MCDGAQLTWTWLNTCLSVGSSEWIPHSALFVCVTSALPIKPSLFTTFLFFTLLILCHILLGGGEWASIWVVLSCCLGLNHNNVQIACSPDMVKMSVATVFDIPAELPLGWASHFEGLLVRRHVTVAVLHPGLGEYHTHPEGHQISTMSGQREGGKNPSIHGIWRQKTKQGKFYVGCVLLKRLDCVWENLASFFVPFWELGGRTGCDKMMPSKKISEFRRTGSCWWFSQARTRSLSFS